MSYIFGLLLILIIFYYLLMGNKIENLENKDNSGEYQPYSNLQNNETFLGLQNASNISFLKSQFDDIMKLKDKVSELSNTVNLNQKGLLQISNQISKLGQSAIGGPVPNNKPLPQVSGLN